MAGGAQAGAVPGRHDAFGVDEHAALAALEKAWADGGCHGFSVPDGSRRVAVSSSGEVLTGNTPAGPDQEIRAHWQALR